MSAAVIGSVNDRSDAAVHIRTSVSTCRVITRIADDGKRVQRRQLIKANGLITASRVCRWCATPENLAAAEQANKFGTGWSAAVEKFLAKLGPQSTLSAAGYNVEHDEERARIAAQHTAFWAEPAPVATPLSKFGQAAANAGYAAGKPKRTVTRRSANSRAKLHNSFRTTVKAA